MTTPDRPATLTQTLAATVAAELLAHERVIERDGAAARSLHVEIAISQRGRALDTSFYVEHRLPTRMLGARNKE
jgi:hypothetical protein